ncbi:MAG: acylphosphatase [Pseudonocardiaceae bacterium]
MGFRWWTRSRVLKLDLTGHAANLSGPGGGRRRRLVRGQSAAARRAALWFRTRPRAPGHRALHRPRGVATSFAER